MIKKRFILSILAVIAIIYIVVLVFSVIISPKTSPISSMTFDEMLKYTTKGNEDAVITIGVVRDGETSFTVYGNNASILPDTEHIYEIGSLTKTFTAALLCKAISEGKVDLDNRIDRYLNLPQQVYYPTLKRLVTHTSGYKEYYFERQMISNFFHGQKNTFYGIDENVLKRRIGKTDLENMDYPFKYSNFGMATVGAVLSKVYGQDFTSLINEFILNDLALENTRVSDGKGDLNGYWNWRVDDAYVPTGALLSTIGDMIKYLNLQISGEIPYLSYAHEKIAHVDATTEEYGKMNIVIDAVGIGWMIDLKNDIIWHNGGTSKFNCYAAFNPERRIGVVVLSNLAPNYRIPATVIGARLMTDLLSQ